MSRNSIARSAIGAVVVAAMSAGAMTSGASAAPSPDQVLISDTQGVIWSYNIGDGELEKFADVTPFNFDITYTGPKELLIANTGDYFSDPPTGALLTLDLGTREEAVFAEGSPLQCPISAAVSPRGGGSTYIADICAGSLFELSRGSTMPEALADVGDDVEVDKRGIVYFAGGDTFGKLDPSASPVVVETITTIEGAGLGGFALGKRGTAYIPDSSPDHPAVYKVDTTTGELLATYTSPEFRNPEDVALAPNGDVYVVDSAFLQDPSNHVPGLYRISADGVTIETLYQGWPLGDPVDILLTPFRGF